MERNIANLQSIDLRFYFGDDDLPVGSDDLLEKVKALMDILSKRDEVVKSSIKMMDEKFEKVWKMPWEMVKIIHSYTWDRDDVREYVYKAIFLFSVPCTPTYWRLIDPWKYREKKN